MTMVIGTLISGLILGGVYALAALGFVIVYRATGVFNFAQGELMAIGAYLVYLLTSGFSLSFGAALILALIGCGLLGCVLYVIFLRPMTGHPVFAIIIVTMGIAIMIRATIGLIWGPVPLFLADPWAGTFIDLGGYYSLSAYDLMSMLLTGCAYLGVIALLRLSPIGLQMRAAAENPVLAAQRGTNLSLVFALSWGLAALTAAIAGAVFAGRSAVSPNIVTLGLSAFPAAVIGGLDSVGGALIGGLIVGLAETVAIVLWGSEAKDVVAAMILLGTLTLRPYGLFGTPRVIRL